MPNGDYKDVNTVAGNPTFNCWHDWDLVEDIADTDRYNDGGILYIEKERVEEKIAEIDRDLVDPTTDQATLTTLAEWHDICESILADIKTTGEDYAEYDCY